MPTNAAFLAALAGSTYPLQGPLPPYLAVGPLLHLLREAKPGGSTGAPTKGLIILTPATTVVAVVVHSVSAELLGFLDYPTEAAYAAALAGDSGPPFVHPSDLEVTTAHLQGSSEIYDARLRRAGGTYRRMRIQGVSFALEGVPNAATSSGELRCSLVWPAP